ncbi:MAG: GspE/PulE family protein [Candidatus Omnitrophota bacterium]
MITEAQLRNVEQLEAQQGGSLIDFLIDVGYVDEKELMLFLSSYLSIPPFKILNLKVSPNALSLIPKETAKKYVVCPVGRIGRALSVAVTDPLNVVLLEDLEKITRCGVTPIVACRSELKQAVEMHYQESVTTAIDDIIKDSKGGSIRVIKEEKDKEEEILKSIDDAPIIKLTNYILKKAVEEKASDIFIESLANNARARYRIDGILREADIFPRKMHNFIISRIKVISGLNIAEHRLPQDGRFRMNILGREVNFRVSILPAMLGEKMVLRVLDESQEFLDIGSLGFNENLVNKLKDDSLSSYGMILVCAPTGSGKTTTLYSILRHIYSPEKNIVTVEDPIEYQLPGVNQVNVNEEVGLTFVAALRSILRQDPDSIMIGEIRDSQTLDISVKAALTGHLVLSTLHTTTASGSVTRIINMGIEPFLLASTLIGVLAQRLVRKLCPKCKEENPFTEDMKEVLKIRKDAVVYKAKGCTACGGQGYKGRVPIGEYLHVDKEVRKLINDVASQQEIKRLARRQGMNTLREDGIRRVEQGLTSLEEILRTTVADEQGDKRED